jgi:hypothetical protein
MMSRTTTLRTTAMMARMTGEDDADSKDNDSKDDGDDGEDDNNDGGNDDSDTVGIVQIRLGINLFWYKFYLACPDMPNRIYSIRIYWVATKIGINGLDPI